MNWLKRDALNRAWRTILQTLALVVIAPAVDAAIQVAQRALVDSMAGVPVNLDQVWRTAAYAAGLGVSMSVIAYIHRLKIDPSAIPSGQPPAPPAVTRGMAQR